jgi:predicted molibdopterin-dependent oxidoreductase YjgC
VRGEGGALSPATRQQALDEAVRRLKGALERRGPGGIAALASPHATNEDLFVLRRLLDGLGAELRGVAVPTGRSDDLLIKAEKAANAEGARALGFGDPQAVLDRIRSGAVEALIALGHDVLDPRWLADTSALAGLDTVILLDTHHSDLERAAHVVFPARHVAEKVGTLTNHAGRVQRVAPAVEPAHAAYAEGEILAAIGAALRVPGFEEGFDPRAVSKAMGQEVPAFAGRDVDSVGAEGLPLAGREATP